MSIRSNVKFRGYYGRKADQHWEMAGLARQDNDMKDAARHTEKAREFEQLAREAAMADIDRSIDR